MVNTKVKTPFGEGIVQGAFAVLDANREPVTSAVLVRLPINEQTKAQMKQSNCMTPRAQVSGLWVFSEGELML